MKTRRFITRRIRFIKEGRAVFLAKYGKPIVRIRTLRKGCTTLDSYPYVFGIGCDVSSYNWFFRTLYIAARTKCISGLDIDQYYGTDGYYPEAERLKYFESLYNATITDWVTSTHNDFRKKHVKFMCRIKHLDQLRGNLSETEYYRLQVGVNSDLPF